MEITVKAISHGQTQKGTPKTGFNDGKDWYNVASNITGVQRGDTIVIEPSRLKGWYNFKFKVEQNGNGAAPQSSTKLTLGQVRGVIQVVTADLSAWNEHPQGPPAIASVLQTIILRLAAGEVEVDEEISF